MASALTLAIRHSGSACPDLGRRNQSGGPLPPMCCFVFVPSRQLAALSAVARELSQMTSCTSPVSHGCGRRFSSSFLSQPFGISASKVAHDWCPFRAPSELSAKPRCNAIRHTWGSPLPRLCRVLPTMMRHLPSLKCLAPDGEGLWPPGFRTQQLFVTQMSRRDEPQGLSWSESLVCERPFFPFLGFMNYWVWAPVHSSPLQSPPVPPSTHFSTLFSDPSKGVLVSRPPRQHRSSPPTSPRRLPAGSIVASPKTCTAPRHRSVLSKISEPDWCSSAVRSLFPWDTLKTHVFKVCAHFFLSRRQFHEVFPSLPISLWLLPALS